MDANIRFSGRRFCQTDQILQVVLLSQLADLISVLLFAFVFTTSINVRTFGTSILVVELLSLLALSRKPADQNGETDGVKGEKRPREYMKDGWSH